MKKFLFLCTLFIILTLCFSQKSLGYWKSIPWNSSEEEIVSILNNQIKKLDKSEHYSGSYCNLFLENEVLYNHSFTTFFQMDSVSNKLESILFKSNLVLSDKKFKTEQGLEYFNALLSKMSEIHGKPENTQESNYSNTAKWFFDTTIVSLSYVHMPSMDFQLMTVKYEKVSQINNFRNVMWGASKEIVKNSESLTPLFDDDKLIGYEGDLVGMKCLIGYLFTDNKLTRARYLLEEEHSNENDFINDYLKLKKLLTKKYGNPTYSNDQTWYNNLYKDDFQDWGLAISIGHLKFRNKWTTTETEISLTLRGDNYKITNLLEYESIKFKDLEEQKQEEEQLNDL